MLATEQSQVRTEPDRARAKQGIKRQCKQGMPEQVNGREEGECMTSRADRGLMANRTGRGIAGATMVRATDGVRREPGRVCD